MKNYSKQYELMKKGESYFIDEFLFKKQRNCSRKISKINKLYFGNSKRNKLLKSLLSEIGDNTVIKEGFKCNYGFNITIGSGCYINYDVVMLDSYEIYVGNNVFIAPKVVVSPVTHPITAKERRNLTGGKIVIEDNVWIGAGAIILPGVTIHEGAVIGAGAVVKSDVEKDCVVAGSPAKFIKKVDN